MSLPLLLLLMLSGYSVGVTSYDVTRRMTSGNRDCPAGCVCNDDDFTVDCSHAGLGAIPHVPPKTKILILCRNSITHVGETDVSRMTHLEELYLQGNRIYDITDGTFRQLLRLKLLDLSDNPLHCGCNLKSELDLFNREEETVNLQLLNLEGTMCDFPRHLRGTSIRVLDSGMADCRRRERRHARHGEFCNSNPCMHGGTCRPARRGSGMCDCPVGYSGSYCEWHQGDRLRVTIDDVTGHYIELRWTIDVDVMGFRIRYVEDPAEPQTQEEQEWLNGTARWYKLTDIQPDTRYEICVAAFGYYMHRRSPGYLIEEVCLHQRTNPIPSTVGNTHSHRLPTPYHPTDPLNTTDGQMTTKMVMTIFGTILSICILLILAVATMYVSRNRGIRLIPRRRRRQSPPNIVQIDNTAYRSTGSPTPSVQDAQIPEENARTNQDNDIPLILVTSDSTEDLASRSGSSDGAKTVCAEATSNSSSINASAASPQDETCSIDETRDLPERGNGDGDSSHEENFENGHLMKDNADSERSEKEIIQC